MHSDIDCSSPYDIHTDAQMMARVLDKVSGVKFVVAHMGGVRCEDEAARLLAGAENVWFDTAYTAGRISPEHMTGLCGHMVRIRCFLHRTAHGTTRKMCIC